MTSKLYEEAIADSKKLKSLLREEVEKDLIEKMKPFMEQALISEIDSFLMEAEEGETPEAPAAEVPEETSAEENMEAEAPAEAAPEAPAAPIKPVGGEMNMPLPDESGMITVAFTDLFGAPTAATPAAAPASAAPAVAPAAAPEAPVEAAPVAEEAPVEETGEAEEAEPEAEVAPAETPTPTQALAEAKSIVSNLEAEYKKMAARNTFNLKEKTDYTYKLVEGYSKLETLKDRNLLRESFFDLLSNKMENLFDLSKNSNKTSNSYSGNQKIFEGKNMKVNANTKSLINSLLETIESGYGKDVAHPAKYARGAGVSKAERAGLPAKPSAVDPGRGKTAMFKHEAEENEDLLKEIAAMEEELAEMEAIHELEEGMEEGKAMGPAQFEEGLEEMDECGMGYDDMPAMRSDKKGKELVIRLAMEPSEGVHEADEAAHEGYMEEGTDEVYEISMEEEASPAAPADKAPAAKPAAPATEALVSEVAALRENLSSNEHLLARSILANKIFAEHDLSRKQKQLVVEYLDRAENVKDAARIYGRIKKQLVEAAKVNVTESKTGSLNESVSRQVSQPVNAANKIVIGSADRFKQLVAGNKNSR
jgi:hypothetical protein